MDNTGTYNLCINQGATYTRVFIWTAGTCCGCGTVGAAPAPVDLNGYSAFLQIRPYALSPIVFYDATANLTLGGIDGTITLNIPADETENFTWWNGVYDLRLIDSVGKATRLLQGTVAVSAGVTA